VGASHFGRNTAVRSPEHGLLGRPQLEVVVLRLVLANAFALAFVATGAARQAAESQQEPVFRSGASLVALNVSVVDGGGHKFVTDLSKSDFAVFEDGVQQQVSFFESSQVPVDLILMIDTSSSMSDKMDVVHQAAVNFLRTLRNGDRGAVVSFADGVQILEKLTADRARLEQAVHQTAAHGGTALNNALYVALREFGGATRDDGPVRRRAIALLTDGEDTSSVVSFDDVMGLARKAGVNIYTIALQSQPTATQAAGRRFLTTSQFSLKSLAQETGAEAFFPAQITDLQNVYGLIAQELSSQYSIGYLSSNSRADGRFRKIVVRVVSHPEMRPRARPGYTADGGPAPPLDSVRR
jgi:Ca-activated chloride channel family protein